MLTVVATPIGNLADLSARACEALLNADLIAAEDTRHAQRLLSEIDAKAPLISLHDHNERSRLVHLLAKLEAGTNLVLISDAGTPLISDPGFILVRAAIERGIPVQALPGPCAAIVALTVSGLPVDRFSFEGFLPAKTGARKRRLEELAGETRTLVFYLSPHRLQAELNALAESFGIKREAALCRELTKMYETVYRAPLGELAKQATQKKEMAKGELTLVVAGCEQEQVADLKIKKVYEALSTKLSARDAVALTAKLTGATKNQIKRLSGIETRHST